MRPRRHGCKSSRLRPQIPYRSNPWIATALKRLAMTYSARCASQAGPLALCEGHGTLAGNRSHAVSRNVSRTAGPQPLRPRAGGGTLALAGPSNPRLRQGQTPLRRRYASGRGAGMVMRGRCGRRRHRRGERCVSGRAAHLSFAARRAADPGTRARACRWPRRRPVLRALRGARPARSRRPPGSRRFRREITCFQAASWRR